MKRYCVYGHITPDGEIFYIGCGTTRRPFIGPASRNEAWRKMVERIDHYNAWVFESSDDHEAMVALECKLIDLHKPSCNLRRGGGGMAVRPSNALYLRDLRPGETFRFAAKDDKGIFRLVHWCTFVDIETGHERARSPTTWVIPEDAAA